MLGLYLTLVFACGLVAGINGEEKEDHASHEEKHYGHRVAVCSLYSSSTFKFYGEILLRQEGEYTSVTGELTGLPRNARLGIHVHEFGNFSDPVNMCLSTGSHFNPFGKTHGCPPAKKRHAGDFGNLETSHHGHAHLSIKTRLITLSPGELNNVVGRAIVLHSGMDDCGNGGNPGSLATGNSGNRIACCPIGVIVA